MRRLTFSLVAALLAISITSSTARADWTFIRGDANADGVVNFVDVINLLSHLFVAGTDPAPCRDALDVNDTGTLDLGDPIYLLQFIFEGSSPPVAPFPICGLDLTADSISCDGPLTACPEFLTEIGFASTTISLGEGSTAIVADVTLTTPLPSALILPYNVAGTATVGEDTFPLGNSIIIAAGQVTGTISIPLVDDTIYEGDESVVITLDLPAFASAGDTMFTATLLDDEPMPEVVFDGGPWNVDEGAGAVTIALRLTGLSAHDISVALAPVGTATLGLDYTMPTNPVIFTAGTLTRSVTFPIIDDGDFEETEEIGLQLVGPAGATLGPVSTSGIIIGDDDTPPTIAFASTSTTISENAGTLLLDLTISPAPISQISVPFGIGGTATVGLDVTLPVTTIVIPPGATTATLPIDLTDDLLDEPDESLIVTLLSPSLAALGTPKTMTVTILDDDPTPTVSFDAASTSVTEGNATLELGVSLSAPSARTITVPFIVSGSATLGADLTTHPSPITLAPGETSGVVTLLLTDDTLFEGTETAVVTLGTPANATLATPSAHTVSIADDDAVPSVSFVTGSITLDEAGGSANLALALSAPSTQTVFVPFSVSGDAQVPADLSLGASPVVFAAGTTTAVIPLGASDDLLDEFDESVTITLGTPNGANLGATTSALVTILDDDLPPVARFTTVSGSVEEGAGSTSVTVELEAPSGRNVSIALAFSGTATAGSDLVPPAGSIVIPAGALSGQIPLTILDDGDFEPNETVTITLGVADHASVGTPSTHTTTILDDDLAPVIGFDLATSSAVEGTNGVAVGMTLDLPSPAPVIVTVSMGGDASLGLDYTMVSATVTLAAGETTAACVLDLLDDAIDEFDETITLSITAIDGASLAAIGTHTLTITDGDPLPTVAFSTSASDPIEGSGTFSTTIALDTPSGRTVTVPVIAGGTATAGVDYILDTPTVTIPVGATTATVTLTLTDDPLDEPNETVTLTLGTPDAALVGTPGTQTVTILDDDGLPEVSFVSADTSIAEGIGLTTITAELSVPSGSAITVPVLIGGTASLNGDYAIAPSTLQFPAGTTTATMSVIVIDDARSEDDESVLLSLGTPSGAEVGTIGSHTLTILDDDPLPTVFLDRSNLSVGEGDAATSLAVRLSVPAGRPVSVAISTSGSATAGADLAALPSSVTIPAGSTEALIAITPIDDASDEPDESRTVTIAPTGTALTGTPVSCVITILDDDAAPTLAFTTATQSGAEGTSVTVTAALTAPSGFSISAPVTLAGIASANDRSLASPTLEIPAGALEGSVTLALTADGLFEGDETVEVLLGTGANFSVGSPALQSVTIVDGDAPPSVSFSTAVLDLTEGNGLVRVGLDISGPAQSDILVPWTPTGTATPNVDLVVAPNPILIPAGSLSANLTIIVIDDTTAEPTEGLAITLGTPSGGAQLGTIPAVQVTLFDDGDPDPVLSLSPAFVEVGEGSGIVTVTAQLGAPSGHDVVVPFSVGGTATSGVDFASTISPLVIPAGAMSANLTLSIIEDLLDEPDETAEVALGVPTGATLGTTTTATVRILDNDAAPTVRFAAAASSVDESAGSATIEVLLDGLSASPVSVSLSATGGATLGTDLDVPMSAITFAPGETSMLIALPIIDDLAIETDESMTLALASPLGATLGTPAAHTLTILDDDVPPVVSFTSLDVTASESDGLVPLALTLSAPAATDVVVHLAVSGTALPSADFGLAPNPVVIPAGSTTGNAQVFILNDALDEPDETVVLTITSVSGGEIGPAATRTVTISDDGDVPPTISFAQVSQALSEGASGVSITVGLTSPSGYEITVPIAIGGSATDGIDHVVAPTPLVIPAGQSFGLLTVTPIDDLLDEANETITLTLEPTPHAILGANTAHQVQLIDDDAPPALAFAAATATVDEGGAPLAVELLLDAPSALDVTVPLSIGGTATTGTDYDSLPTTVTIPAGQTSTSLTLAPVDDLAIEGDEEITLALGTPTNATAIAPNVCVVTILDDDVLPSVSFTTATQVVGENSGQTTVTLSIPGPAALDVTVPIIFSGSATHFSDYVATPLPVVISAGQTSATLTVILLDDTLFEGGEEAVLSFGTISGGQPGTTATHTITIADVGDPEPSVAFAIGSQTIAEGTSSATIEVRLSALSGVAVTVPLSVSGNALLGTDLLLPGATATIPAGQQSVHVPITVIDDALDEPAETATVSLGIPTGAILGGLIDHTITVLDNDAPPSLAFATATSSTPENASATTMLVTLSAPSAFDISAPLSAGGNATAGVDYSFAPSTVMIPAGQTEALVTITIVDDLAVESDETVSLSLGSPVAATLAAPAAHTLTILDNDLLPTVTFASSATTATEDVGIVAIEVSLSAPTAADVIVPIGRAGTATAGQDYTLAPNPLTILAGQTSATTQLVLIDDALNELTETVILTLGTPTGGTLGTATAHTVTILDAGDPVPSVSFAQAAQTTTEGGGSALLPITLSAPSGMNVTVPITLGGSAIVGEDHSLAATPLVIPAGQTSLFLPVTILDDPRFETSEALTVTIGTPTGASVGPIATHTITIHDDDPIPSLAFQTPAIEAGEGSISADMVVVLSAPAGVDVTVPFTQSGSATAGSDYAVAASPLVIPAGTTSAALTVQLVDDPFYELDEELVVTLGTPTHATLGAGAVCTLLIVDNEDVPEVSFTLAGRTEVEGNTLISIGITLSVPTGVSVAVPYSTSGSAAAGSDYALPAGPAVIAAGSTSTLLSLVLIDDSVDENDETIAITLDTPTGAILGAVSTHTVTVTDNGDLPPTMQFSLASSSAGEETGIATLAITLDRTSGRTITLPYSVSGTATAGQDYFVVPGPMTIPAGTLATSIAVQLVDDLLDELPEAVLVTLGAPSSGTLGTNATHALSILDDDLAPQLSFETAATNASENAGTIALRLLLDLPSGGPVSVPYTITGSATAGSDFTAPVSPLVIPAGATEATLAITLTDDSLFEGVESIVVTLGSPSGADLEAPSVHTITVLDDEQMPIVSFANATGQVNESAGSFTAEVVLSIPASEDVVVPLIVGGNADPTLDFAIAAGPVVIPAGQTSASLTVIVHEDFLDEADELVTLSLGPPTGADPGAILVRSTTIIDDDPPPSVVFLTAPTTVAEGSGVQMIEVGLSAPSGLDAVISWTVTGNALPGLDFQLSTGSVTIPAGSLTATFTIDILADTLDEPNESVVLALGALVDAVAGVPATTTITILDDDTPPTLSFQSASSIEGEPAGTILVPVSLSAPSGQDILVETLLGGSATQGTDYLFSADPVRIDAGETSAFLTVTLVDDVQIEADETITLTLIDPTNANLGSPSVHTITVLEDDIAPTVSFALASQDLAENAGSVAVAIQLSEPTGIELLIPYTVSGTADIGGDATVTTGPIVVPAGQTSAQITLTVIDDALVELDETVTITLGAPVNGVLGGNTTHTVTILDDEVTPVANFAATSTTTSESGAPASLVVTLSTASTLDITIGVSVTGTASLGTDAQLAGSPVLIPAGQTSATITVTPIDDLLDELDETVIVTLTTPNHVIIGLADQGSVTIADDDAAPSVGFSNATSSTTEGSAAATVTAILSAPSGLDITVPFTLSGSAQGNDVTVPTSPLVILAGETQSSLGVFALADGLDEPDETLTLTLGAPTGASLGALTTHTTTIVDADPSTVLQFSLASSSALENAGSVTVGLELSAPSGFPVTAAFLLSGTATPGVDAQVTPATITIPAGQTTTSVTVDLLDDPLSEGNETFVLTLDAVTDATIGVRANHTVTIGDDDPLPIVSFDLATSSILEGTGAAQVGITLSAPSGAPLSIPVTFSGTASLGADYTAPVTPVLVPPGAATATITVPVIDDGSDEPAESITLALGVPTGAQIGTPSTHTMTIEDDDVPPTLAFVAASATLGEAAGSLNIELELSGPSASTVTAPLSYFGTATLGVDHTPSTNTIEFLPGNLSATLTLTLTDDTLDESDETIIVVIENPSGATLGAISVLTVTVTDDDLPPNVHFAAAASTTGESSAPSSIIVSLDAPSGLPVTVPFTVSGSATAGSDFTIDPSPLVIAAGSTSGTITVDPAVDPTDELDETVILDLGPPTNATLAAPSTHTLTIQDESALPSVFFAEGGQTRLEGSGTATVDIHLSAASALPVTVALAVGGTASEGSDRGSLPNTATFPIGSDTITLLVPILSDALDEPDETVTIEILGAIDGVRGLPDLHTITIADDDAPPTLTLGTAPASIGESGGVATIPVLLDAPSSLPVTVPFSVSGSATAGADHTVTAAPLVIPAGSVSATITVSAIDDALHESTETVVVTLAAPTNATLGMNSAATITILDDEPQPVISFGTSPTSVPEGVGTIIVPVELDTPSALPITVPLAIGGSASAGSDYQTTATSVSFAPGTTTAQISIAILDDLVREETQSVLLELLPAANTTLGANSTALIDILDDEPLPVISISPTIAVISEAGGIAPLTVTSSLPSETAITVPIAISGSATPSVDTVTTPTSVVIGAGLTGALLTITAIDDPLFEMDETVIVTLGTPTNATPGPQGSATVTILDDETRPTLTITGPATLSEGAGSLIATITVSGPIGSDLNVPVTISGTASAGSDFTIPTGLTVIPAGTLSTTVTIALIDDAVDEVDETLVLTLGTAASADLGSPSVLTTTINDDDPQPALAFSQGSATVDESAGTIALTVSLSAPSSLTVTAPITVGGSVDPVDDLSVSPTLVTIPAGQTTATIDVTIIDDGFDEPDEIATIALGTPTAAALGTPASFALTITDNDLIPAVQFDLSSRSVDESAGTITATIVVSVPSALPITVPYTVTGAATPGADLTIAASPLSIPPGAASATVSIAIIDDAIFEGDESATLLLGSPTNASLGVRTSQQVTILDDDPAPTVEFTSATSSIIESGGQAMVGVTLSAPAEVDIVVPLTTGGTATIGVDAQLVGNPLLFAAGSTTAQVAIDLFDDALFEGAETITIGFGASLGATPGPTALHTLTIDDDDSAPEVTFATASSDLDETAGPATIAVLLSEASALPTTIPFAVTGSASVPADLTVTASPLVIPAGATSGVIELGVVDDLIAEGDETLTVTLDPPTNGTLGIPAAHTVTILDDDLVPTVSFATAAQDAGEANGIVQIAVQLSDVTGVDVTVPFTLTGTAVAGLDYVTAGGPLVIPAGSLSASISLTVFDDALAEPSETVIATLGTPVNANLGAVTIHTTTLLDDEATPSVSFATASQSVGEGATLTTVSLLLSSVSTIDVSVPLVISGSASIPGDATITPATVVIPAGTLSANITVTLVDDLLDELDETLELGLGQPTGAVLGAIAMHTLTLVDDDLPPSVSFLAATTDVTEGDLAFPLVAELSSPSGLPISVPLILGGDAGNAGDLTLGITNLLFPAGATTASVTVTVIDDVVSEATETATITLGASTAATLGAIAAHTVTILDNEDFPSVSFALASSSVAENLGSTTLGLILDAPSAQPVSVEIALSGNAAGTGDATIASSTVLFPSGTTTANLTVDLVDDLLAEGAETLVLTLTTPNGVQLGATTIHTLTITDDEASPSIAFSTLAQTVPEGGIGSVATLVLSGPRDVDTVVNLFVGGTASTGIDFIALPTAVLIPAGDTTSDIAITPLADILHELDETIIVSIGGAPGTTAGTPATHTATILDDDDPPLVSFTGATATASEGDGVIDLVLLLSTPSALPVSVTLTASGTAVVGTDIAAPPTSATIAAGSTSTVISTPIIDDALFERPETLTVTIGNPSEATIGTHAATTVTILDDDPAPEVRFAGGNVSVDESAGTIDLTVLLGTQSAVDIDVPYTVGGSASSPDDFASLSGVLTIPAGSPSAALTLSIVDDILEEGDETIELTLGTPSDGSLGSPTVTTVTILDDDAPGLVSFAATDSSVGEGAGSASVTVVVNRVLPTDVTVPLIVTGTAADGADFAAVPPAVTVLAGQASATVPLTILDDLIDELDETVVLTLGIPTGASLGTPSVHTITILDDELPPVVSLVESALTVDETGPAITLTVGLDLASGLDVSVPFTLTGTATSGEDFLATASPLTIVAGDLLASLTITPQDDLWDELDETVIVTLDTPTNATLGSNTTATVTLTDDDPTPTVTFTTPGESVSEGGGVRTLTLELSSASDLEVTVPIVVAGTATDGDDFTLSTTTATIAARTLSTTLSVTILEDAIDEPTETVELSLGAPTNATLGGTTVATISILDDDPIPTVQFVDVATSVGEAATTVTLSLSLSNPSSQVVSVPYTLSGTAATPDDYTIAASPLSIAAGDTAAFLTVTIIDDLIADGDETFVVTLGTPTGANLGLDDTFTGTILDDESTAVVSFTTAASTVGEGGGSLVATVELSIASAVDLTVPLLVGGTATVGGVDASVTPNPLVIPAGSLSATVAIVVQDDLLDELDETVELTIDPPLGTVLGAPATHTVTITDDDAAPTVAFVAASTTVAEGAGSLLVEVALDAPSGLPVTVPLTIGGSAAIPDDATVTPDPLVIPAGAVSAFFTIALVADALHELDETITIGLGAPTAAILGAVSSHTVTITDDDAAPTVAFSLASSTVLESAGVASIDLTLDAPSGLPVTVAIAASGTATAGADYTAPGALATIPAGATTATIAVAILQDLLDEAAETVVLTASAPTDATLGTPAVHTLTIDDDDNQPTVGFATANVSAIEDLGPATLDIVLSPIAGRDVTVEFSVGGTATTGDDYTAPTTTVVIPAGSSSALVTIPITADLLDEPDETVSFTLTTVTNALTGGVSSSTLTILDDDDAPTVAFSAASSTVGEGDPATTVEIALSAASGRTVTVPFTTAGTATLGDDATVSAGPLTFAPGTTTATITVTPAQDLLDENDETVLLTLGSATNTIVGTPATHTVTILDDDLSPTVTITAGSDGAEPSTDASMSVALSEISARPVTAMLLVGGTATRNDDYTLASTTITIPAGQLTASVSLPVIDDTIFEGTETVTLTVGSATNATLGVPASATVNLADNETQPSVSFATAVSLAGEGAGTATVTVNLSGESASAVTVPITVGGTAATPADFTVTPIPLVIAAGTVSAQIQIAIVDDTIAESDETVTLALGAPTGATLGGTTTHTFTISDDDGVPTVSFATPTASLDESGGNVSVVVELSGTSALDVTVPFTIGGTTDGSDRTVTASPLVIPAGSTQGTIDIAVTEDLIHEGNETVSLAIGLPVNGSVGSPATFTLTILDNDAAPTVRFQSASQTVTESVGTTTITLELLALSALPATIDLVLGGTATNPDDYTLSSTQVTIPAGSLTADVTLTVAADTLDELDETVIATIDAAAGALIGSPTTHTVTITDDDLPPTVAFAIAASNVSEGVGTATVDAVLSAPSAQPITVAVSAGGTASAADATLDTPLLTFAPGAVTASASVTVLADALHELDETVILTLATPTNATLGTPSVHTVTITDDDPAPVVQFSTVSQSVAESIGTTTVTVIASAASDVAMVLPFSLSGTASNGTDFTITASPVTLPAGGLSATITVTITPDAIDELDETIVLTLDTPTGATLGANTTHTATITDDDGQPSVSFEFATSSAPEVSGTASVRVILSTPSGLTVSVPFSDTGTGTATAGVDYTAPTSPLTIAPGQTEAFIAFPILDDFTVEPDETVVLQLLTPTNAVFGAQASHTFTITDEDGIAPCLVAYPEPDVVLPPGVAITPLVPTFSCGTPTMWTVAPALPNGLSLDPSTGAISGTPTMRTPRAEFTVTATNPSGSDSTVIAIRIDPVFEFFAGTAIATYDPVSGNLIPAGGSTPDPLATIPVSLFLQEGPNNDPVPNTFAPTVGLSIALEYDAAFIDPQQIDQGADLASMNGGAGPDFWGPQIGANVVTIGALYSIDPGGFLETLTADVAREIAIVRYAPAAGSLVGDVDGATVTLPYGNPNGPTAVQNEVVLDGSTGVDPVTTDVVVEFVPQSP